MKTKDVDVLLLAAGFGTRLRPLTDSIPKPLLPFCGKCIIDWNLELLASAGFRRVFINLHYLGSLIREHVGTGSAWGLDVHYLEEPVILDTGGAIRNFQEHMRGEALLVINADIVLDRQFPFAQLLNAHKQASAEDPVVATMVLRRDEDSADYGQVGMDRQGVICHFRGHDYLAPCGPLEMLMFTGIHVLSRNVFEYMPPKGLAFSITRDTYRMVLECGSLIRGFLYNDFWEDLGTIDRLRRAEKVFATSLNLV